MLFFILGGCIFRGWLLFLLILFVLVTVCIVVLRGAAVGWSLGRDDLVEMGHGLLDISN